MAPDVSAILLAAGSSTRMGTCKQLLVLGGRPAIVRCIETLTAAGVREIIVVSGACGDQVEEAIGHLEVTIVRNCDIGSDMAASVRVGLSAVANGTSGVMICLTDQPLVAPGTCRQLLKQHMTTPDDILIPIFEGKKGHPTIFPLQLVSQLLRAGTLRDIITVNPERVRLVEVADPGVALDMDTPEDYQLMRELFERA